MREDILICSEAIYTYAFNVDYNTSEWRVIVQTFCVPLSLKCFVEMSCLKTTSPQRDFQIGSWLDKKIDGGNDPIYLSFFKIALISQKRYDPDGLNIFLTIAIHKLLVRIYFLLLTQIHCIYDIFLN